MSQMEVYPGWYRQAQSVSQLMRGVYQLDIKNIFPSIG